MLRYQAMRIGALEIIPLMSPRWDRVGQAMGLGVSQDLDSFSMVGECHLKEIERERGRERDEAREGESKRERRERLISLVKYKITIFSDILLKYFFLLTQYSKTNLSHSLWESTNFLEVNMAKSIGILKIFIDLCYSNYLE